MGGRGGGRGGAESKFRPTPHRFRAQGERRAGGEKSYDSYKQAYCPPPLTPASRGGAERASSMQDPAVSGKNRYNRRARTAAWQAG